ncbi:hypothetical protein JCM6882_005595 [Rhodosporidiobolus microsporus]
MAVRAPVSHPEPSSAPPDASPAPVAVPPPSLDPVATPVVQPAEPPQDAQTTEEPARVVARVRPGKRVLIPPPQFGMVEEGLYRSGQPTELNLPFVEKLGLKSIVWLAPEDPNEPFMQFIKEHNIRLHHLGADDYAATYDPVSEETVLQALNLLLDPANAPVLVGCNQGRHRTGTCIGVFRKLQRWNLTSILEEYRRFAGPKVRVLNEQFIELFDCELARVPSLPEQP